MAPTRDTSTLRAKEVAKEPYRLGAHSEKRFSRSVLALLVLSTGPTCSTTTPSAQEQGTASGSTHVTLLGQRQGRAHAPGPARGTSGPRSVKVATAVVVVLAQVYL